MAEVRINTPGEEALENELTIVAVLGDPQSLENAARMLDMLENTWTLATLLGRDKLNLKDYLFIMVIWLFVWSRIYYRKTGHNMQQLGVFYWVQLVFSVITGFLSAMQLYSQDFSMTTENIALIFFYVMALIQALIQLACGYLLRRV